jgi:2-polyprenyl-6-methoxyphenol hydroxylase-like FAD-dependent oxidoreductase
VNRNVQPLYDVGIVGAGPAGLFLACLLSRSNVSCILLEREKLQPEDARIIGLLPSMLRSLESLDLRGEFEKVGTRVSAGKFFRKKKNLHSFSIGGDVSGCEYVLRVRKGDIERILEQRFCAGHSGLVVRGVVVDEIGEVDRLVRAGFQDGEGNRSEVKCALLAGCDGKFSTVRRLAGIAFIGSASSQVYAEAEFSNDGLLGGDALCFLNDGKLVESFPGPSNVRQWVIRSLDVYREPSLDEFIRWIFAQTGIDLSKERNFGVRSVGTQHYLAAMFHKGRVVLAGDSAHIVNPIGGYGMNFAWMDALQLSEAMIRCIREKAPAESVLEHYSADAMRRARQAIRHSKMNMLMGRILRISWLQPLLASFLVKTILKKTSINRLLTS